MVPGLLLKIVSSVSGWKEGLPLAPLWGLLQVSPSWPASGSKVGSPNNWLPTFRLLAASAVWAPGSLRSEDPTGSAGCVCGRRREVSQDQSAPYTSELGNLWDTETVQMSCFSSAAKQENAATWGLVSGSHRAPTPAHGPCPPSRESAASSHTCISKHGV